MGKLTWIAIEGFGDTTWGKDTVTLGLGVGDPPDDIKDETALLFMVVGELGLAGVSDRAAPAWIGSGNKESRAADRLSINSLKNMKT